MRQSQPTIIIYKQHGLVKDSSFGVVHVELKNGFERSRISLGCLIVLIYSKTGLLMTKSNQTCHQVCLSLAIYFQFFKVLRNESTQTDA
jgi:hypothetical protein